MSEQLALYGSPSMTVKEVAEALGVTPEAIKKHVRDMYPALLQNGVVTCLSEEQVTAIKRRMIPTTSVVGAVTSIDIERMTLQVIQYHAGKVQELEAELALAAPKVEMAEALMHSDLTMSITDAAKHFGLHPKAEVFPYLRDRGYLTARDLPTFAAICANYLELRETRCPDGEIRKQAVVPVASLDIWRLRVVPQIARWKAEALA